MLTKSITFQIKHNALVSVQYPYDSEHTYVISNKSKDCDYSLIDKNSFSTLTRNGHQLHEKIVMGASPKPNLLKMEKFEGVANTTFVPLVARINISKKFPDLFYDKKALELEPYLPPDAGKGAFEYTNLASVARYYNMDEMVNTFVQVHTPCNVIYFGAGLESAYFRLTEKIGLGKAKFYEIDVPEVIETRRKVFGEQTDEKFVAGDMFALDWVKEIDNPSLPTIMLVSGVFQYFTEPEVLKFIADISEAFPGQELIFDATSTSGLKFTNWFIKRTGNASALMKFGVDDSVAFAKKANAELLEERLFFPEIRKILGSRANFISRFSMRNADNGKKTIILHLKLHS